MLLFIGEALEELTKAFVKAYDGSVLVIAVTTDVAHTRRAVRSVPDQKDSKSNSVCILLFSIEVIFLYCCYYVFLLFHEMALCVIYFLFKCYKNNQFQDF